MYRTWVRKAWRPVVKIGLVVAFLALSGCAVERVADLAGDGPLARLLFGDGLYALGFLGGIVKGIGNVGKAVGGAVVGGVKEAGKFVGRQVQRLPAVAAATGAGGPLGGALAIITGEVGGVAAGQEPDQRVLADAVGTPPFAATDRGSFSNVLTAWVDNVRNAAGDVARNIAGDIETDEQRMQREQAAQAMRGSTLTSGLLIGGGVAAVVGLGLFLVGRRR